MSTEVANALTAYLSMNSCRPDEIPAVADAIRQALDPKPAEPTEAPGPALPTPEEIEASITPDYLVSFEDGKQYKVLGRHLTTRGLTVHEYRQKWGLPSDYPVVAPSYSARRAELAKAQGFGQTKRTSN